MKIGELSERSGLSRDTIRFYERNGLIASEPGQSGTNSYRHYPEEIIPRLSFISQAREAGMSVSDLRDVFDALQGGCEAASGIRVIEEKIAELEDGITKAEQTIAFLKAQIAPVKSSAEELAAPSDGRNDG